MLFLGNLTDSFWMNETSLSKDTVTLPYSKTKEKCLSPYFFSLCFLFIFSVAGVFSTPWGKNSASKLA